MTAKPPPMKEAVVVVLDIGHHMTLRGEADMDKCRAAAGEFLLKKIQFSRQDEVGVLLAGSRDTQNPLNSHAKGQYLNIAVKQELKKPNCESVRGLAAASPGGQRADLLDALIVAADMLQTRVKKLRFRKRIFLFTAAGDPVAHKEDLEKVVASFSAEQISLVVVGVDFTYLDPESAAAEEDWEELTVKQQNEKVLWHLTEAVGGDSIVTPLSTALLKLSEVGSKSVTQRTSVRGCLEFGEHLKIPLFVFVKAQKAGLPSLRRVSKTARALDGGESSLCKVDADRRYFRSDDPEKEVDEPGRVKAFRYGCTSVPFNEFDEKILKFDGGVKGFKVLAFIPRKSIKRHQLLGGTSCFAAPPGDPEAAAAFRPLLQAMYETDTAALLRAVRRSYSEPVLLVAWPHLSASKEVLYAAELPFCEDLRKYDFRNLGADPAPTKEQLSSVDAVLDLMSLDADLLRPREIPNPSIAYFNQNVRSRVVDPSSGLVPLDRKVASGSCLWEGEDSILSPLFRKAAPAVNRVVSAFGVAPAPNPRSAEEHLKKRKFWFADGSGPALMQHPSEPRKKLPKAGVSQATSVDEPHLVLPSSSVSGNSSGGGSGTDLAAALAGVKKPAPPDRVTTVDPVRDFLEMVGRRDGDFVLPAIRSMSDVVRKLLQDSIGSMLHEKAFSCVKALRRVCIDEGESPVFNAFLKELQAACLTSSRKQPFWTRLVQMRFTLISTKEAADAGVTDQEAETFISSAAPALPPPPSPAGEKDNDLFDALD